MMQEAKKDKEAIQAASKVPRLSRGGLGDMMGAFGAGMPGMGGPSEEVSNLTKKLNELDLPEETRKIVEQEISKVSRMSPSN